LKHLPRYNDIGKHNGRFLSEELGKIKGLIPPLMPSDWTSMLGNGRMVKCGMEYITTKTEKSNTRYFSNILLYPKEKTTTRTHEEKLLCQFCAMKFYFD
jgi:hypothetical protein